MPQAPYALLRASINGGAATTGGITVPALATVQLSADPAGTSGAFAYRYEIYGYPVGFAQPSGWSTDSAGVYFYSAGSTPPIITLPTIANWGKFMLRLKLNNGISPNPVAKPPSDLVDEGTALSLLSPNGLADVGLLEENQFGNTWVPAVQASLRKIDTAVTAVAGANAKPAVALVATSNISSLSGEQTIDSLLSSASRVLLTAQTTASQNGLWVTAAGAWARPVDFASDSQVIVGQTVFVTSGTINTGTNWQLTSGSTIAGAKTYAKLAAGVAVTILQPADAVATTNLALSGTSAVDGVALTASVTRVLVVAQTTPSQNGLWVAQSGAWTRPADFTTDAQVVAGQSVYVNLGGTLGGGTSWKLTVGSTIAGSKTYTQVVAGKGLPPVRLVQTTALPAYTYGAGVFTQTTNAVLATTVFDGITPSIGDSLLLILEGVHNGIVTVLQLGNGSTQPTVLTRRADLFTSANFIGGVQVDVLDGATAGSNNKGTRWAMTTLGTVTLDTTSTTWAPMRERDLKLIDLSKSPYFVIGYSTYAAAVSGTDYAPIINQAFIDNPNCMLQLPAGFIKCQITLLPALANAPIGLQGESRHGTFLVSSNVAGSPFVYVGAPSAPIAGPANIDNATNNQSIQMWDADATKSPFLDCRQAGLYFDRWAQFECRFLVQFSALAGGDNIASTRGRLDVNDPVEAMHTLRVESTGQVTGSLRTWSPSAVIAQGTAPPAVTISFVTITAIPKYVFLRVEITFAGARGTAKFRVSLNDGKTWLPFTGGSETALTAATVALGGPATGVVLNFATGTNYSTDNVYRNQETLSVQTPTLTVAAAGADYMLTMRWDGTGGGGTNTLKLYTPVTGAGSWGTPSGAATVTGTLPGAVVNQLLYEDTLVGDGCNAQVGLTTGDGLVNPIQFWLGSFFYDQTLHSVSGTVPASLTTVGAVNGLFLCPRTDHTQIAGGGIWGWIGQAFGVPTNLMWRQRSMVAFVDKFVMRDIAVNCNTSGRDGILLDGNVTRYQIDRVEALGCFDSFTARQVGYYGRVNDFHSLATRYDMLAANCELSLGGETVLEGLGIPLVDVNSARVTNSGVLWITPTGGFPLAGVVVCQSHGTLGDAIFDDEGTGGFVIAACMVAVSTFFSLSIGGRIQSGKRGVLLRVRSASSGDRGILKLDGDWTANSDDAYLSDVDAHVTGQTGSAFQLTPAGLPLANNAGHWVVFGGKPTKTAITSATPQTLVPSVIPGPQRAEMAAGTTVATTTVILPLLLESLTWRVRLGVQANDVVIVNGGAAGGTLATITAGGSGVFEFVSDGTNLAVY